jgi:hypothetical protein
MGLSVNRGARFAAAVMAMALITTVLLGAAKPATAAGRIAPVAGLYKGKTAQGAVVSFRVRGGKVIAPSYTVSHKGCGLRIAFTTARRVNRKERFFFGRRASDFFTGVFSSDRKVRGEVGVDFSDSACPGRGVHEARFRARRID